MTPLVRPYMLFNEQLFRFEIYRTCDGNYLFLDLHHIVADGTSLAIIINDINRAYSGQYICSSKIPIINSIKAGKNAVRGMK